MNSASQFIQWGLIIAALGLFTIREEFDYWVILGLVLLVIFFSVRILSGNFWPRSTGLEGPVGLFVLSAALATWISYDFSTALLQFARILAAVALFSLIAEGHPAFQRWLAAGFLAAAFLLALYWPLQHDFSASQGKFQIVDKIGSWIETFGPEFKIEGLTGPFIHPNVAAGTLALAVPFGIAFIIDGWQKRSIWISVLAGLATLAVAAGLLLTGSRGTWVGLACTAFLFCLAWIQRQWYGTPTRKYAFWGVALVVGLLGMVYLFASFDLQRLLGSLPGPSGTAQTRVDLWRQGWGLVQDYFFTGSGLGTFWMVHAFYSILLHVPFIAHTHNTFLEVWIEQGVLGALALLWGSLVILTWYWRALDRRPLPLLGVAGMFGLASMFIHGMIDVVFYIERTLPLVGFTLGYAWLAVPKAEAAQAARLRSKQAGRILVLAVCVVLALSLFLFRNSLFSTLYSNLGSLRQTRAELSAYDPNNYEKLSVDQARQSIDYSTITGDFKRSLTYNPANQTALQRLSMIALSRGDYASAWDSMQVAWEGNQRDLTTQLLYADAAIANGFPEKAAAALQGNPWAEMHLMGNAWSRYWTKKTFKERIIHTRQYCCSIPPTLKRKSRQRLPGKNWVHRW